MDLDFTFDKSIHQRLRDIILDQERYRTAVEEPASVEVITDPLEIEKAFREDDL